MMLNSQDIIVIGGNVAGPSAAAKAKRTNPNSNVILFEAGEYISTGSCQLPYILSGEIKDYSDLIMYSPERFLDEKKVLVKTNTVVKEIDRRNKQILYYDNQSNTSNIQKYDKLVLCTGSNSKKNGLITENIKNVFYLKTIKNFLDINSFLEKNFVKNITIIGAGYIGLEVVEALISRGYVINLIEKKNLPLFDFDEEVSKMIFEKLSTKGINFYPNIENLQFDSKDGYVKNIRILNQELLHTDLVLTATGFEPNNLLAHSAKLDIGKYGGLKVDNKLRTSDTNIFAAGDNTELINCVTNRPDYFPFATIAHDCGHIAGANAAGNNLTIQSVVKNVSLSLFDYSINKVGLNQNEVINHGYNYKTQDATVYNKSKNFNHRMMCYAKMIYQKDTYKILGASFIGGEEVIGMGNLISFMIKNNIGANKLTNTNFSYTPKLSSMINILEILGRKILQN
ncbi:MAG: FAD-dependent oxidoreductase [Ignavibacteriales bacterium]|nr:FAD-dependent oxidoreductase [Ignavibacteriales bacterium]